MFFGSCLACSSNEFGYVDTNEQFYCNSCWEDHKLFSYRCFSFAAVYDLNTGKRLSTGGSVNSACAERQALWKLGVDFHTPKVIVVSRIRRNRNNKKTNMGGSKPCSQCIISMNMYNVQRVCYSGTGDKFTWENVSEIKNDYKTKCNVILRL